MSRCQFSEEGIVILLLGWGVSLVVMCNSGGNLLEYSSKIDISRTINAIILKKDLAVLEPSVL